jgi:hypothetical protein
LIVCFLLGSYPAHNAAKFITETTRRWACSQINMHVITKNQSIDFQQYKASLCPWINTPIANP